MSSLKTTGKRALTILAGQDNSNYRTGCLTPFFKKMQAFCRDIGNDGILQTKNHIVDIVSLNSLIQTYKVKKAAHGPVRSRLFVSPKSVFFPYSDIICLSIENTELTKD